MAEGSPLVRLHQPQAVTPLPQTAALLTVAMALVAAAAVMPAWAESLANRFGLDARNDGERVDGDGWHHRAISNR